ncbi:F-box-like domain-containing protein [Cephalotus follicularis]|uniref:F-box-like domain-containing protein n=1 Tax=Cephalotus follicularis TaxID=3775 RepID=A0A1Q3CRJ3_CEPFO|nr:F-box-like domain-containing protein [Cephalotus follicularis]
MMSGLLPPLPDELWREILEMGIKKSKFTYKDLCSVSISCRHLHRLSNEDSLWSHLLFFDFPVITTTTNPSSSSSPLIKSMYKIRFERERERILAAHRRAILRKESQIGEHSRELRRIEALLNNEREKLKSTVMELSNLSNLRQASVALNVWQPNVIRDAQEKLVEQSVVPFECHLHGLEMELRLCKQQITAFDKAHRDEKQRFYNAKEELMSLKYHPLRDFKMTRSEDDRRPVKGKMLKKCVNCPDKEGKKITDEQAS